MLAEVGASGSERSAVACFLAALYVLFGSSHAHITQIGKRERQTQDKHKHLSGDWFTKRSKDHFREVLDIDTRDHFASYSVQAERSMGLTHRGFHPARDNGAKRGPWL